jgi:hypothetical protein
MTRGSPAAEFMSTSAHTGQRLPFFASIDDDRRILLERRADVGERGHVGLRESTPGIHRSARRPD